MNVPSTQTASSSLGFVAPSLRRVKLNRAGWRTGSAKAATPRASRDGLMPLHYDRKLGSARNFAEALFDYTPAGVPAELAGSAIEFAGFMNRLATSALAA